MKEVKEGEGRGVAREVNVDAVIGVAASRIARMDEVEETREETEELVEDELEVRDSLVYKRAVAER